MRNEFQFISKVMLAAVKNMAGIWDLGEELRALIINTSFLQNVTQGLR
jgi:hypothetical protein